MATESLDDIRPLYALETLQNIFFQTDSEMKTQCHPLKYTTSTKKEVFNGNCRLMHTSTMTTRWVYSNIIPVKYQCSWTPSESKSWSMSICSALQLFNIRNNTHTHARTHACTHTSMLFLTYTLLWQQMQQQEWKSFTPENKLLSSLIFTLGSVSF